MGTVWFILIFVIVASLYGLLCYKQGNAETVIAVEAGSTAKASPKWINSKSFKAPRCQYKINGEVIDSSLYMRLIVEGNCMIPRGIASGDQLLALKVNDIEELKKELHQDNIVLIYLEDVNLYKIRIFDKFDGNNLLTYYFENGKRKNSSKPHSASSIKGIVKYAL